MLVPVTKKHKGIKQKVLAVYQQAFDLRDGNVHHMELRQGHGGLLSNQDTRAQYLT